MRILKSLWFISILFLVWVGGRRAIDCQSNTVTITVDASGQGNFSKVQDAVNSIPSQNTKWIRILLKAGVYREQVNIGPEKTCIVLEGEGRETTSIEFNAHDATDTSATFTSLAENFVARKISFKNTYNVEVSERARAVAAGLKGDKASFYSCGFYGLQDTLWDAVGRHYFENCEIQGAVDFIWGSGQSIYSNCHVLVNAGGLGAGIIGFITAQGRSSQSEGNGFVFTGGVVDGNGAVYLGRAYGSYSRVIFYRTNFSKVIYPLGWDAWNKPVDSFTYAEYECEGPGANNASRVSWEKKLSSQEIKKYTDISFIDREGWVSQQRQINDFLPRFLSTQ